MVFDDQGQGLPILLIHGFPLCRRMWKPQVQPLVDAGYRVVVPDLPGFGDSPPLDQPWSMDLYGDGMIALLDQLGIGRAVVGGMSMGGYVLLNLLDRHPERVAAAVFIATRAGADDPAARERRTELSQAALRGEPQVIQETFGEVLFAEATLQEHADRVQEVRCWMEMAPPRGLAAALVAMRDRPDYTGQLSSFSLPALVIGGSADRVMTADQFRLLGDRLPCGKICLIPEGGHLVNLERPEPFNACLLEFLRGL